MEQKYKTNDVRKLYDAFIQLCDYIEEYDGCGKCPLWNSVCSKTNGGKTNEFKESLAKIRNTIEEDESK